MQPTVKSVTELFQQRIRFVVPLFQRTYVWNVDDQWHPLWEDIERQAQKLLAVAPGAPYPADANHFLGAIVVQREVGTTDGSPPSASVIDGQQRLTTLQVLLAAIRDYLSGRNHTLVETLKALTSNTPPHARPTDGHKVWPTNSDREAYAAAMTSGSLAELKSAVGRQVPTLCHAYQFFFEEFKKYVETGGENSDGVSDGLVEDRINAVYNTLASAFRFVVIELDANEDPQIIFESLNARGEPLLPSDLIKNHIFLEASEAEATQWYPAYWQAFETELTTNGKERFWRQERELLRERRPFIDVFFYVFLLESGDRGETQPNHLYQEFKSWRVRSRHSMTTQNLLERIRERADLFRDVLTGQRGDRVARTFDILMAVDAFAAMPLLLNVLSRGLSSSDERRCCEAIESFFVRRWFCTARPRNTSALVAGLLSAARQADNETLAEALSAALSRSAANGHYDWHDDRAFLDGWMNRQVYVKSRQDRARCLLRVLEHELGGSLGDGAISIEHILPQAADDHRYPFSDRAASLQANLQRRKRLIDTVGNLTLLEGRLNPQAGDRPFTQKKAIFGRDSSFQLNRSLAGFDCWSEDEIEKRAIDLFDVAIKAWPAPPRAS